MTAEGDSKSRKVIPKGSSETVTLWQTPTVEVRNTQTEVQFQQSATKVDNYSNGFFKALDRNEFGMPTVVGIEAIQKQAYDEAYEEGLIAGRTAGQKELEESIQQAKQQVTLLTQLMERLHRPFQELDQEVEQQLVSLTIALAKQVVKNVTESDYEEILAVVREAVQLLPVNARGVKLYLHPEEVDIVNNALRLAECDEQEWQLVADPALSKGGCLVKTENSKLDATLESRLQAAITQMMGAQRKQD